MSAHLSNEIVERFHNQSLSGGDRGVIYTHILGCAACRQRVVTAETEAVAVTALTDHLLPQVDEEPYHLDAATIEAFVDDKLEPFDRNIAKLHLEDCAECSDEVTDLRESLATMRAVSRNNEPESTIVHAPRRRFVFSVPVRIAATIAIIAFAALALLVVWRWKSSGPTNAPDRTAGSQPTPMTSPQSPSFSPSPGIVNPNTAENPPENGGSKLAPSTVVALKDGAREIAIDQAGNISGLFSLPAESRQAVKEALTGEKLTRPDVLSDLATADVAVRAPNGNEERIKISYPVSIVVPTERPTLRWDPAKTADGYQIEIADELFHRVAQSENLSLSAQSWKPSTPLKRGQVYTWTIRAVNAGGELSSLTSQGKFKVLSEEKVREMNQLKASQSHLALGVFFAHEGMTSEAEREFGILVKENPDSAIAKKLLREVRSWSSRR